MPITPSSRDRRRLPRFALWSVALMAVLLVAAVQPWQPRAVAMPLSSVSAPPTPSAPRRGAGHRTSIDVAATLPPPPGTAATPSPTPAVVRRPLLAAGGTGRHPVLGSGGTGPISNLANTTSGVHFGDTFDSHVPVVNGTRQLSPAGMPPTDYVWGASPTYAQSVPDTTNGWHETYTPWRRENVNQNLAWLKANHPDWIEYKCDKSTIAYWYSGQTDMPDLDMTSASYQSYFINNFALPALANGFKGISYDNGPDLNVGNECGHWTGAQGTSTWVAQYSGAQLDDAAYATANGNAMLSISNAIHAQYPNATITSNQGYNTYTLQSNWEKVLPGVSMITDEYSFNVDGTGYLESVAGGEPGISNQWLSEMQEWQHIQRDLGKGIFFINVLPLSGALGDYASDTDATSRALVQWALANYLMVKYNHAYLYLTGKGTSGDGDYGYAMIPQHEYPTVQAVGAPTNDFYANQSVYRRDYTGGVTFVNPDPSASYTVNVPAGQYKDLYGNAVTSQTMGPHTGMVLLATTPQATATPGGASTVTNTPIPNATATVTPTGALQAIEAEAPGNTLGGPAAVGSCALCSGGQDVQFIGRNNGTLRFNGLTPPSAGTYSLGIDCVAGDSSAGNPARTFLLQINGGAGQMLTCPATPHFAPITEYATVALNAGSNTALVSNSDPTSPAPDIDRVTLYSANAAPTATVAPASGPYVFYDNQLENGTRDYSYGLTSHSFAATSPTYGGSSASIAAQYTAGSYGAVKLRLSPTPFNPAPYATLHVALYPGTGATTPLLVSLDNNTGANLGSYAVTPPAGQWTTYDIPLSTLDPSGVPATDLLFADEKGAGFSYNIDDVRLVPAATSGTPAPAPTTGFTVASATPTNTPSAGVTATNTPTSMPIGAATPTATPPSGATATPTNTPQPTATNTPQPTAGPGSPTPPPAPYSVTLIRVRSTVAPGGTLVVAAFVRSNTFLPRPRLTFTVSLGNTTVVTLTPYRARLYIQAGQPIFVVATWHVPSNATLGGYTVVGHLATSGGASLADSAPQSFTLAAPGGGGV